MKAALCPKPVCQVAHWPYTPKKFPDPCANPGFTGLQFLNLLLLWRHFPSSSALLRRFLSSSYSKKGRFSNIAMWHQRRQTHYCQLAEEWSQWTVAANQLPSVHKTGPDPWWSDCWNQHSRGRGHRQRNLFLPSEQFVRERTTDGAVVGPRFVLSVTGGSGHLNYGLIPDCMLQNHRRAH